MRPSMRFVPIKTKEQQTVLMLHRTHRRQAAGDRCDFRFAHKEVAVTGHPAYAACFCRPAASLNQRKRQLIP